MRGAPPDGRSDDRAPAASDDVRDEIRNHILECADLLEQQGWTRPDALREAERRFGDVAGIERELSARRGFRGFELLRSVGADVRYALRGVRGNPGFTLAIIATLALGIGAASSIFAVVDALLLRPLAYRDADRLVELNHAPWQSGGYTPGTTAARVTGWREAGAEFADGWIAWSRGTLVRMHEGVAEELDIVAVTPGADTLLGIPLLLGRALSPEDARPGAEDVAVLGRGFYERLGADPAILGRRIRLESGPVTVVGVLRGGIRFPTWGGDTELWIPIRDDFTAADRPVQNVSGFWARLRPGVTLDAAQRRAGMLAAALDERNPLDGGWDVELIPVGTHRVGPDLRRALLLLAVTVGAILLIAAVNGVNLLLVRTSTRGRELAVRMAIGGSRARLLRQLLVEGTLLGVLGGLAALALAVIALSVIRGIIPWVIAWSSPHALEIETRTLAFTFAASLLVGVVLGLVPALQVTRDAGVAPLARRQSDDTPDRRRLRSGLVIGQVALSMTLLAGAGLFVKSFARLLSVDPGFDPERIALAYIGPSPTRYADAAARGDFFRRLEETLVANPAIEAVSRRDGLGFRGGVALEPEDGPPPRDQPRRIPLASITPGYLDVMGIDLVDGRDFDITDIDTNAAIIDRDLARFLWSGRAVERRFRLGEDGEWLRVVGVVRDLRMMGRDQREGPYQILRPASPDRAGGWVELAIRTTGDPRAALDVVKDAVRRIDPEQLIWRLRTAADALSEDEEEPRFLVTLMILLAGIAVALAAIGLYGVLAFSVARRDRELAVRMALGAEPHRVRGMVMGEGLVVAAIGVVLGTAGALAGSRLVEQLLYEVSPHDAAAFAAAASVFLAVGAAASFVPARRATRVNPAETLRRE